jgi:hypothetical protein
MRRDSPNKLSPNSSLNQTRAKVWMARTTSTLFDVKQYCTDFERLLHAIWKRHEEGLPPDHILQDAFAGPATPFSG